MYQTSQPSPNASTRASLVLSRNTTKESSVTVGVLTDK